MEFSERFLYHIWDAQHLNSESKTVSGKNIRIMFQGSWNTDSGPDFKNAIINIDGEVLRGDVEAHKCSYDWIAHKHNENQNFNNVILHIVFAHNGHYSYTINQNGKRIEILEISKFLDMDISKLLDTFADRKFEESEKYCPFFAGLDNDSLLTILEILGIQRLESKIRRFSAELYFSDFNQLLVQGIFEALGYRKNKFQMLQLALKFPFSKLKEFYDNGISKEELIAIYLCSSNLISHLPKTIPTEYKLMWQELFAKNDHSKENIDLDWNFFRLRPVNHPAIRILQIIDLVYDNLDHYIFNSLLTIFSIPKDGYSLQEFQHRLWKFFQTESMILPEKYCLGKSRIDTIFINIILPLVILYSRKMTFSDLENAASNIYRQYKKLPANSIINRMDKYLSDSQRKATHQKAIYQQGILHLYYYSCQHHNCKYCESLKKEMIAGK